MSVILFFTYMLNMFTNVPFLIKLCDLLATQRPKICF